MILAVAVFAGTFTTSIAAQAQDGKGVLDFTIDSPSRILPSRISVPPEKVLPVARVSMPAPSLTSSPARSGPA